MHMPGALLADDSARLGVPPSLAPAAPRCELRAGSDWLRDGAFAGMWDLLASHASEPNPFAERWYLSAALNALGSDAVRVAVVRDDAGSMIGMLPLIWQSRYAGLPVAHVQNWLNHNAFLGTPLVLKGAEQAFWANLLAALDGQTNGAIFLHLTGCTTQGPVMAALAQVCTDQGRRHGQVHHEERALLEHGLSPDAYLEANVRGKKRKELRRQHKRLAEEGTLSFERCDGRNSLELWIAEFLTLEMAGWKGTNGSALACAPETQALFANALHAAADAGKLERLTLRLDGRAIAMLANFITPPGSFSFKTAFDEDYARFSPGVLLQIENLALLQRADIAWCDSCAAQDHPMIDSLWSGRRAIGRYSVAIGGTARRAAFAALLTAERAKAKVKGKAI
jgi:CelD/BcsL family acetyltransferase involved in cellulose biosynthesis